MPRKRKLEGIETREVRRGTRYRGTAFGEKGPWTGDIDEAREWRKRKLRDAEDGLLSDRRLTLAQAIEEFTEGIEAGWIENKKGEPYRGGVVRLYTSRLALVRSELGGKTRLDELRLPHVRRLKTQLKRSGRYSDSTIRNTIIALRALYAWACQEGYAPQGNPCAGLPLPVGDRRVRNIVAAEHASLLTGALTGADRVAFALAWLAGLRAGEILALFWTPGGAGARSWIDLDERWIHVETAVDTNSRHWQDPKTYAGRRRVPIRAQLLAILEDYLEQTGGEGLLFPARQRPGRPVSSAGKPMGYSELVKRLKKRWSAAGLEGVELHAGRHTFVSILIAAGEEPAKVMEYAGHSSITVTYDLYGHLFPADYQLTLRRLDDYDARASGAGQ